MIMLAVLLAAGRSKRLWPLSDKNFLSLVGKPLIEHQIGLLEKVGCKRIVVVAGEHNRQRIEELSAKFESRIECVEQKDLETGLAGAVLASAPVVKNEPFVLFSSNDVLSQTAFELIFKRCEASQADVLLLGKKVEKYFPGGYMEVSSDNELKRIVEKPEAGQEASDLVNVMLHIHKKPKELFALLEKQTGPVEGRYEEVLNVMLAKGHKIEVVPYDGFWQALKYPWHVLPIVRHFFSLIPKKIGNSSQIASTASIQGEVILEEGVKIFDYVVISGPCYLGKNTIVANHSLVREAYIGDACVIGYSTEVARSYLGNRVWTHSNYIGDSMISDDCAFGAGTVTGNLRLDEKEILTDIRGEKVSTGQNKFGLVTGSGVRAGINVSFMPGVKIGAKSFIGAGIVVPRDIPDNVFVTGSWDLQIRENRTEVNSDLREIMRNRL